MIEVIDDYLPLEQFQEVQRQLLNTSWPWYFNDVIDSAEESDVSNLSKFQFTYAFFHRKNWVNSGEKVIWPLTQSINPIAWLRIKANLNTWTPDPAINSFHIDQVGMGEIPFYTSIFYVNTNNGKTLFKNGTEIQSIANRLITFPGTLMHTGCSCTDAKRRVLINFNYIK
jgi:hypothetical protein